MQSQDKNRFWTEIRQGGWLVLIVFFALAASRFVVEHFWGRGWAVVAAAIAAAAWFVIRPWRFGLIGDGTRRGICYAGAIALCGWVVVAASNYWRF